MIARFFVTCQGSTIVVTGPHAFGFSGVVNSLSAKPDVLEGPACVLIVLGGLVIAGVLVWRLPRLHGTTLVAPWAWTIGALASLVGSEAVIFGQIFGPWLNEPLRFIAAVSTFCPAMAILGAKRPQDRGWKFIVASLWLLLAMPAIQTLLMRPGEPVYVYPAWSWFFWMLIGLGWTNYLLTRFWLSASLVALAQGVLLAKHLPGWPDSLLPMRPDLAIGILVSAALLWAWQLAPKGSRSPTINHVWIDFRDWFGAVWALRVAERLRASSAMYDWQLDVTWQGFPQLDPPGSLPVEVEQAAAKSLRIMLRRFVSPEWIDERYFY